eukprot:CAMPEP_0175068252 /NCGR_PEP_ID=MMETSP0052_2-20121109/17573_1 /TAXON_ID=51329 ORGANISM="Polytomella parva, Strain SAG 63-3" /NCGR_SAMPLE_ID=MMETSP0052_2 /ASSEMBLY_ACC=CAM_ASM_000194 /LENGTH=625 /DNA_ID=CAMNT_0016335269 /DNA_START=52 /DNA_END=1925 /DNA_ORIENTATION=+
MASSSYVRTGVDLKRKDKYDKYVNNVQDQLSISIPLLDASKESSEDSVLIDVAPEIDHLRPSTITILRAIGKPISSFAQERITDSLKKAEYLQSSRTHDSDNLYIAPHAYDDYKKRIKRRIQTLKELQSFLSKTDPEIATTPSAVASANNTTHPISFADTVFLRQKLVEGAKSQADLDRLKQRLYYEGLRLIDGEESTATASSSPKVFPPSASDKERRPSEKLPRASSLTSMEADAKLLNEILAQRLLSLDDRAAAALTSARTPASKVVAGAEAVAAYGSALRKAEKEFRAVRQLYERDEIVRRMGGTAKVDGLMQQLDQEARAAEENRGASVNKKNKSSAALKGLVPGLMSLRHRMAEVGLCNIESRSNLLSDGKDPRREQQGASSDPRTLSDLLDLNSMSSEGDLDSEWDPDWSHQGYLPSSFAIALEQSRLKGVNGVDETAAAAAAETATEARASSSGSIQKDRCGKSGVVVAGLAALAVVAAVVAVTKVMRPHVMNWWKFTRRGMKSPSSESDDDGEGVEEGEEEELYSSDEGEEEEEEEEEEEDEEDEDNEEEEDEEEEEEEEEIQIDLRTLPPHLVREVQNLQMLQAQLPFMNPLFQRQVAMLERQTLKRIRVFQKTVL